MAGFIPEDNVNEVRNACNIVDVVSQYLSLKKSGRNHIGLCPFHSEKTPSFTVSDEKQIFHCFGCGQGGNVFTFLMLYHNVEFPEAVQMVAQKSGVPVKTTGMSAQEKRRWEAKERLLKINRLAAAYFRERLEEPRGGRVARAYLEKRQIPMETSKAFVLGYAPSGWENLVGYFSRMGWSLSDVERAGLIISKKDRYYDRFRERIIFPILDIREKVVGFGGRALDDSLPKYLNSPETPVYHKGKTLYGLAAAKQACRRDGSAYVVEGYFDLLALHRAKIENVVATLGTALTREQIRTLKGYARRIVLVFDSDAAGIRAAERSLPLFAEENVEARIMTLPSGKDPDSFICEYGGAKFRETAEKSLSMMGFLLETTVARYGLSLEGKVKIVDRLKEPLRAMKNHVGRAVYVRELANRLDVDESAILEQVRTLERPGNRQADLKPAATGSCRLEKALLGMMIQSPELLHGFDIEKLVENVQDEDLQVLGRMILKGMSDTPPCVGADLIERTTDPGIRNLISSLVASEWPSTADDCLKLVKQYETHVQRTRARSLSRRIKAAEQAKDEGLLERLLAEKQRSVQRKTEGLSY